MTPPLAPLSSTPWAGLIQAPVPTGPRGEFRSLVEGAISRVENARAGAAQSVERLLSGEAEELHSVVLATQKAELALELFLQVRNKVVQAYQEIMRMQM